MPNKQLSYSVRDFQSVRTELVNFVKSYYPDLIQNTNDASIFSVFLDLNAAVTDNLNNQIDRTLQETVLQFAQQKSSVYNIARTYGLRVPGQRPSVALVDFSIIVPADGDAENLDYCGVLRRGSQITGAGQVFENLYDIDFASPYNNEGFPNRLKIPNFDANNQLINYTIVKREPVVNGTTKVFKKVITNVESKPFYELFLPERNVLGVTNVLLKDGTNYANIPTPEEFLGTANKWYEVDALAQDRIFVEDPTKPKDSTGIKVGKYIQTSDRFITEYTAEGFFKITFGGGSQSTDELLREYARNGTPLDLSKYQNNYSLGSILPANKTLFIQYRVGGGLGTNLGPGTINQVGTVNFVINGGTSQTIKNSVINSLGCNNVTAAIGGANFPSVEEVRNLVGFNFSSQNRAVTINDYETLIRKMPSQFGAPAKVAITEEDNKIKINLLSYDTSGALTNSISNILLQNVATYLSNYRMINDYIYTLAASVIDLSFEIYAVLDASQNSGSIISNIINTVSTYLSPSVREMGQDLYMSELKSEIQKINGVISITEILVYNKVGGNYSSGQVSQTYSNTQTRQIKLIEDTIYCEPSQILQVRFPQTDIVVRIKNLTTVNFS
jgi:hypothetical protein